MDDQDDPPCGGVIGVGCVISLIIIGTAALIGLLFGLMMG
jgi:hypothetical protein